MGGDDGVGEGTNPAVPGKDVPCPFSVEPNSAEISAGGEQVFTVRFAPQEVRASGFRLIFCLERLITTRQFCRSLALSAFPSSD